MWVVSFAAQPQRFLATVPKNLNQRILRASETRLVTDPLRYGKPLRGDLTGLWKLRVGDYRVIYTVRRPDRVAIGSIRHRKDAYRAGLPMARG